MTSVLAKVNRVTVNADTLALPPRNLLTREQATFEFNTAPTGSATMACGWQSNNASLITFEWTTDTPAEGTRCLHVSPNFGGGSWPTINPALPQGGGNLMVPCIAGNTYTGIVTIRLTQTVAVQGWFLVLSWYNDALQVVGTAAQTSLPKVAAGWVPSRVVGVAPTGATRMRLSIQSTFRTTDGSYYLDKCGLYGGDVPDWHSPTETWAYNMLSAEQADFETNTTTVGGQVSGWLRYSSGMTITNSTAQAASGTHSLALGPNGSGGVGAEPRVMAPPAGADARLYFPATPGRGYTALLSYFPSSGVGQASLVLTWENDAGVSQGTVTATSQSTAGLWTECLVQGICPATATRFWFRITNIGVVPAAEFAYIDKAGVYLGYVGTWIAPGTLRPRRNVPSITVVDP